jgi:hypothetical protein
MEKINPQAKNHSITNFGVGVKKIHWILLTILLLGAFLRFYRLGETSFVADEFLDINSSYAYLKTGVWQNWDFNRGVVNAENEFAPRDERAWAYKWQVAELFQILPPTEAVARSVSAAWGVLTIFLIFFIARDWTKRAEVGLLSAFFFAVSISGIIFDRRLRMYAMFFPIFLLFSWLTYKFLESRYGGKIDFIKLFNSKFGVNIVFLVPAILFGLLSFHIHQLTGSIVMITVVYFIVQYILELRTSKNYLNKYLIFLGVIVAGILGARIAASGLVDSFFGGIVLFTDHPSYLIITLRDYSHPLIASLLIILGAYHLMKNPDTKKEGIWLVVSFLAPLFMAMFLWRRNVGEQYIFFAQSFLIILLASGVYFSAKFFQDNLAQFKNKAFIAAIVLAAFIVPQYGYFFEENNAYRQTSEASNPNYRSIFTYFKKNKKPGDVLISRNFRNYYWSGEKVKTFDFGGEMTKENFSLEDLQKIIQENPSGWFIYSDNDEDFIANDAEKYALDNLEKINAIAVRGKVKVYRW